MLDEVWRRVGRRDGAMLVYEPAEARRLAAGRRT